MNLLELAEDIDGVFFVLGAVLFTVEVGQLIFRGKLRARSVLEVMVNLSTLIPTVLVDTLLLSGGYALYWIIAAIHPSPIPVTAWSLGLVVIAADLNYYWEHRISHETRLLWTQHAVHHSSREMNIATSIRFGPFEGLWSLFAHIPLALIGFSPEAILFGITVVLAYQTWLHTELIGKLGPLEQLLNTPSHHRVHHGCNEAYLDKNYGGIFIVWDRLFGTLAHEEEAVHFGLKRDFESQNPLLVWFSELPSLLRDLVRARSLSEMARVAFGPPR